MEVVKDCPLCHQGAVKTLRLFYQDQVQKIYLKKCPHCGIEALNPQPNDQLLSEQYQQYYKKRGSEVGKNTELKRFKKDYFLNTLHRLRIDFSSKKILEIGGGEGDFASALLQLYPSVQLTVVESNEENKFFFQDLNCRMVNQDAESFLASANSRQEKYDGIFLFDVLEHFREPQKVFDQLVSCLSPSGHLIASFPNSKSFSRKLMGPLWFQYKLEHLFYFSRESVSVLAASSHSQVVHLSSLRKSLPLDYLLLVGKNFGPVAFQKLVKFFDLFIPQWIRRKSLPLYLGEWLCMWQKKGS